LREPPGTDGIVGLGVDQAKEAVCVWFVPFRDGCEVALRGAASQPASIGDDTFVAAVPLTSCSKSSGSSDRALLEGNPVAPNDMKSSFALTFPFVPDNSCNFLVCSDSTRVDKLLMSSMKAWNCVRSSKGPKLILHNTGRMSMATKSASATPPTSRRTFSDAIATAGSFVLIALIRGTIFSCIVYLSRAVEELFLLAVVFRTPSSPSLLAAGSFEPPHKITNASRPRTLIPSEEVLVNTEAMTGNRSFFIVEKSNTGRMSGRLRKEASTML
jgi:hypothetical protein